MILWRKGGNHNIPAYTIYASPGVFFPNSDFLNESGKPILFAIDFKYGKTDEIKDNLAHYLVDQGLAQETRFIL